MPDVNSAPASGVLAGSTERAGLFLERAAGRYRLSMSGESTVMIIDRVLKVSAALLLGTTTLAAAQSSPIQWPLSEATPHIDFPKMLVNNEWMAAALEEQNVVVLDVRGQSHFKAGHIPDAVHTKIGTAATREGSGALRSLLGQLGITGTETVVICGSEDGFEAIGRAFWLLESAGHPDVKVLAGGIEAWKHEGRPLSTAAMTPRSATFTADRTEDSVNVDVEWLRDSTGQAGVELLDVRDAGGWEDYESPHTFVAGHIPGSLPYHFTPDVADASGWPDPAAIRDRLGKLGLRPGNPVNLFATFVVYGENAGSSQVGLAYLLLRLAGIDVRVFPEGFERWRQSEATVREITTAELRSLLEEENPSLARDQRPKQLIFIDLREVRDYCRLGHLPGAYNLPFRDAGLGELYETVVWRYWSDLRPDSSPVVFYCYGWNCIRSRKAAIVVSRLGYKNILVYRGSSADWEAEGFPLFESPFGD